MSDYKPFVAGPKLKKKIRKYFEAVDIRSNLYYESDLTSEKAKELKRNALCLVDAFDELIKKTLIHEAPKTGWHDFQFEYYDNGEGTCRASRFCPALIKDSWTAGLENMAVIEYDNCTYYTMEICVNDGVFSTFHKNFAFTSENPDTLKQFMMLAAANCKTVQEWYKLAEKESKK